MKEWDQQNNSADACRPASIILTHDLVVSKAEWLRQATSSCRCFEFHSDVSLQPGLAGGRPSPNPKKKKKKEEFSKTAAISESYGIKARRRAAQSWQLKLLGGTASWLQHNPALNTSPPWRELAQTRANCVHSAHTTMTVLTFVQCGTVRCIKQFVAIVNQFIQLR